MIDPLTCIGIALGAYALGYFIGRQETRLNKS